MNEIKCPLCGKVIGEYILDGVVDGGGFIGSIPCYSQKLDHRKASRVHHDERRKHGTLCRRCARQMFPEGKYYLVMVMHGGKPISTVGKYMTRKEAEEKAESMTRRLGYRYWVEEHDI